MPGRIIAMFIYPNPLETSPRKTTQDIHYRFIILHRFQSIHVDVYQYFSPCSRIMALRRSLLVHTDCHDLPFWSHNRQVNTT